MSAQTLYSKDGSYEPYSAEAALRMILDEVDKNRPDYAEIRKNVEGVLKDWLPDFRARFLYIQKAIETMERKGIRIVERGEDWVIISSVMAACEVLIAYHNTLEPQEQERPYWVVSQGGAPVVWRCCDAPDTHKRYKLERAPEK